MNWTKENWFKLSVLLLLAIFSGLYLFLNSDNLTGFSFNKEKQGQVAGEILGKTDNQETQVNDNPKSITPTPIPTPKPKAKATPTSATQPVNTIPVAPLTPIPQQQENTALKIANCQAKRDLDYSNFISQVDQKIVQTIASIKSESQSFINNQLTKYDSCKLQNSVSYCSFYLDNAQRKKDYTEQLIQQAKNSKDPFLSQAKAIVDSEYYTCINK